MKALHNILSGIYDIFCSSKKMFVLMIIGIISSDLILIYCYSSYAVYKQSSLVGTGVQARKYSVSNDGSLSFDEIEKLEIGADLMRTYDVTDYPAPDATSQEWYTELKIVSPDGTASAFVMSDQTSSKTIPPVIRAFHNDITDADIVLGEGRFDGDPYEMIVPYNSVTASLKYDPTTDSYGTVDMDGHTFRVIGVSSSDGILIIPYGTFIELGYQPEYIGYYTLDILPREESVDLRESIAEAYGCGNGSISYPYRYYDAAERDYISLAALLFLVYLISMLAFLFYMMFFAERSLRTYAISHICGASKSRLVLGLIIQNTMLSVVCAAAAFAVNVLLSVAKINIMGEMSYTVRDIVSIFITVVISTFILTVPSVCKITGLSAAELYRDAS